MTRQRIVVRRFALVDLVSKLLVSILAIAVGYYGAMVALAALKLDPRTINQISAYRTIQTKLTSITASNITATDRIIVAAIGVLCLLVFAPLAWRALPRAYRARTTIDLGDDDAPGRTRLAPRTVEEVADHSAVRHPAVTQARTRYGNDHLHVGVQMTEGAAEDLLATLEDVQHHVRDGLHEHGLPQLQIDITLTAVHQGDTP